MDIDSPPAAAAAQQKEDSTINAIGYGSSVTLTNDLCVPLRFSIQNQERGEVESVIVDAIGLIPLVSNVYNLFTIRGIAANYSKFLYNTFGGDTFSAAREFFADEDPKEGILQPAQSVRRRAASDQGSPKNVVKLEYIQIMDSTTVKIWTIKTKGIGDGPREKRDLKVSDVLKDEGTNPPSVRNSFPEPWIYKKPDEISLKPKAKCGKFWQVLRMPNIKFTYGGKSNISTSRPESYFCTTAPGVTDRYFPPDFMKGASNGERLAMLSMDNMVFIASSDSFASSPPSGKASAVWLQGSIPIVRLPDTEIKNGNHELHQLGTVASEGKLLEWIWGMVESRAGGQAKGCRLWAVTYDKSTGKYYELDEMKDAENRQFMTAYTMVKQTGKVTFFIPDRFMPLGSEESR